MTKSGNRSKGPNGGFDRRDFVKRAALSGIGIAGGTFLASLPASAGITSFPSLLQDRDDHDRDDRASDTAQEIFTAALIAEDLAITMYYNSLIGGVIQDPNLAGSGGNLANPENLANVGYLQGALSEEIVHANLLRTLIGGSSPSTDPVQTFYFPTGTFDNLQNFFPILLALETAFIGAYLTAVHEFSLMAAEIEPFERRQLDSSGKPYTHKQLTFFAQVAASILGVESEHRTLARAIPSIAPGDTMFAGTDLFPADNLNFEQTDGFESVYNGSKSAVVALTPFITNGSGKTGFSFATATANASGVSAPTTGGLPQQ
jgi:hypothetical protein